MSQATAATPSGNHDLGRADGSGTEQPLYSVLLKAVVNLRVDNVRAPDQAAAVEVAKDSLDLYDIFARHFVDVGQTDHPNTLCYIEYGEDIQAALVDVKGDEDLYLQSRWFEPLEGRMRQLPEGEGDLKDTLLKTLRDIRIMAQNERSHAEIVRKIDTLENRLGL